MDNDYVYIFLYFPYCRMYNYIYLCTNKGKNMTKITIRLINPILRIHILRPAMLTNFMQNWREHCSYRPYSCARVKEGALIPSHQEAALSQDWTHNLKATSQPLHHRATRHPVLHCYNSILGLYLSWLAIVYVNWTSTPCFYLLSLSPTVLLT